VFLNDYAAAIVSTIHQHSGDLLKMIDDGLLAICPSEDRAHACAAALDAVQEARASLETLNERAGRTA
jgi:class 3 adenylate cyclase